MIVSRAVSLTPTTKLPLFSMAIPAGPPITAEDYVEDFIDLTQHLTPHPDRSFLVRVSGDSMVDAGISDGDLLVVERGVDANNGDVVVALVGGQFTVKMFRRSYGSLNLVAANTNRADPPQQDFSVWGVARYTIHKL